MEAIGLSEYQLLGSCTWGKGSALPLGPPRRLPTRRIWLAAVRTGSCTGQAPLGLILQQPGSAPLISQLDLKLHSTHHPGSLDFLANGSLAFREGQKGIVVC